MRGSTTNITGKLPRVFFRRAAKRRRFTLMPRRPKCLEGPEAGKAAIDFCEAAIEGGYMLFTISRGIFGIVSDGLLSMAMVVAIGFLLVVSLVMSAVLAAMGGYWVMCCRFPLRCSKS